MPLEQSKPICDGHSIGKPQQVPETRPNEGLRLPFRLNAAADPPQPDKNLDKFPLALLWRVTRFKT